MYGADISLLHSLETLDREKFCPLVLLPEDMPQGMLTPELERLGVEYSFVRLGILRRKYLTLRSALPFVLDFATGVTQVRSIVRRRRASVVYVNTIVAASGALGGRLAGVAVLWHVHEMLSYSRPVRWALLQMLGLCADRILCVSKAVLRSLTIDKPSLKSKCSVLYNAVASTRDVPTVIPLRQELQIGKNTCLVGMVGRVTYWKGHEVLAEAASHIMREHPDTHFVAVGSYFADESHYLDRVRSVVQEAGVGDHFHLLEYRTNVTDVYRSLDVFVLPSVKPEPFGRVTVEAMMQGCCVVGTDHGGTCELIQDGVTGLLVRPSDPKALAEAVSTVLRNPSLREQMGVAAAAYAKKNFSLTAYGSAMQSILEELTAADCRSS